MTTLGIAALFFFIGGILGITITCIVVACGNQEREREEMERRLLEIEGKEFGHF